MKASGIDEARVIQMVKRFLEIALDSETPICEACSQMNEPESPTTSEKPSKQARWQRKMSDAGVCQRCGAEFAAPGSPHCKPCLVRMRKRTRKLRGHRPWKEGKPGRPVKYL